MRHSTIGSRQMGQQLVAALGLADVPGIVKLQITAEPGSLPLLTVVRAITVEQAGAACALLKEWNCELQPTAPATERQIRADGSVGEAMVPPSPSFHPREG